MIKEFFSKLFLVFKRKPKEKKEIIPIIPDHAKAKMEIQKRKDDVNELKKIHVEQKEEKVLVDAIHESIADKKLIDIELDEENEISLFKVSGIYSIGQTQMLTGFLETGRLRKGMKSKANEVLMKLTEIRKDGEEVKELLPGQEGTLTINAKRNPLLKQDDYLEFE